MKSTPRRWAHTALLLLAAALAIACDCDGGGAIDALAGEITPAPNPLDFGAVAPPALPRDPPEALVVHKTLELRNSGSGNLVVQSIAIEPTTSPPIFTQTGGLSSAELPLRIGPGQTRELQLAYSPVELGASTAGVVIGSDDPVTPIARVQLTGSSVRRLGPSLLVCIESEQLALAKRCGAPLEIDFGEVPYEETRQATITIESDGTEPVVITSARAHASAHPAITYDPAELALTLQPGESRSVGVTYVPSIGDDPTSVFEVRSNDSARNVIRVESRGRGLNPPGLCLEPVPLDFGEARPGVGRAATLNVINCGDAPFEVTGVEIAGNEEEFSVPRPLGSSVWLRPEPGRDTFPVELFYSPRTSGADTGRVRIRTSIGDGFAPLIGVGGRCEVVVSPNLLNFLAVPSVMDNGTVVVENVGLGTCNLTRFQFTARTSPELFFWPSDVPSVPVVLRSGESTVLNITYSPNDVGVDEGSLEIIDDDPVTPSVFVELHGVGTLDNVCLLEIVPSSLSFGAVAVGETRVRAVEIVNSSPLWCNLISADFDAASDPALSSRIPGLMLPPNASLPLPVAYQPTVVGTSTGTLVVVTDSAINGTFRVPVTGTSAERTICVEPRRLEFGPTSGGATMDVVVSGCGRTSATVTALDFAIADPEVTLLAPPALPFTVLPGASQILTVQYLSADQTGDTALLRITSDDLAEPQIDVRITGGPEIVPPTAGRFLYFWRIDGQGDVMRLPLQGSTQIEPYWGPSTGRTCTGCHTVSPDGAYVGVIESGFTLQLIETRTHNVVPLWAQQVGIVNVAWNPDPNTTPPHQFAYSDGVDIHIAAVDTGYIRPLLGADTAMWSESQPSWGPDGKIAFVRSAGGGGLAVLGPSDIMTVDEAGGVPELVNGASANNSLQYYPAYSPNGAWIAFTLSPAGFGSISAPDAVLRLVRTDQSGLVLNLPMANSAAGDGASSYPTWSADGRFLSFSSNRSGGLGSWDLYLAPIDQTTGTDGPAVNSTAANSSAFEHAAQWSQ